MSEFDELVEGYVGPLADPAADPGPLSADEEAILAERLSRPLGPAYREVVPDPNEDEPPFDPDDWPEEEAFGLPIVTDEALPEGTVAVVELRVLKADQIPQIGVHYVVFNGIPRPVIRANYAISEDEHVRTQMGGMEDLKDADGQRKQRADRTIRMRYRGYLCGEVSGL